MFCFNFIDCYISLSGYGLDGREIGFRSRQRQKDFSLVSVSRPALELTQPPVQWVPGILSPGLNRGRGVTLTTHPHLVPRSRVNRSSASSPSSCSMACCGIALTLVISSYTPIICQFCLPSIMHFTAFDPKFDFRGVLSAFIFLVS
jgi:hypothetical protein